MLIKFKGNEDQSIDDRALAGKGNENGRAMNGTVYEDRDFKIWHIYIYILVHLNIKTWACLFVFCTWEKSSDIKMTGRNQKCFNITQKSIRIRSFLTCILIGSNELQNEL